MSLQPSSRLYAMSFSELAALLYRDLAKVKHAERARFQKELEQKKQLEDSTRRLGIKQLEQQLPPLNNLAVLFVEQLLAAP